jgi:hypothetical protein
MFTKAPLRAHQSYRHEALLWQGRDDFLAGVLPIITEGLDDGEAVMVMLTPEHLGWVRAELGSRADDVDLVDMVGLGRNPARIIPAWLDFLEHSCGPGRPARGIGEPVWPGRRAEELAEAQLHEALLNLAVDPHLPFWLVCPYDVEHLDGEVLADVDLSHPAIATASSYEGSASYRGKDHARELFTADLPALDAPTSDVWVTELTLSTAAEEVTLQAIAADLLSDTVVDLTDVVRELVVEGLGRGSAGVRVRLWDQDEALVCEITDRSVIDDFLVGRRPPSTSGCEPLWFANQVFDLVQVRSGGSGTSVRLHVQKNPFRAMLRAARPAARPGVPSPSR